MFFLKMISSCVHESKIFMDRTFIKNHNFQKVSYNLIDTGLLQKHDVWWFWAGFGLSQLDFWSGNIFFAHILIFDQFWYPEVLTKNWFSFFVFPFFVIFQFRSKNSISVRFASNVSLFLSFFAKILPHFNPGEVANHSVEHGVASVVGMSSVTEKKY